MMATQFRPMLAGDVVQLGLQASQIAELEAFGEASIMGKGRQLAELGDAWTASWGNRIVACGGFLEQQAHEAVAWIALAREICPAARVGVVRFAARMIDAARYERLEALVDCDNERAVALAKFLGLRAVALLRKKGADRRDQLLLERVV